MSGQPAYGGIKDVLTSVYKDGGMRALYRGIGMYDLFCYAFYFTWMHGQFWRCMVLMLGF